MKEGVCLKGFLYRPFNHNSNSMIGGGGGACLEGGARTQVVQQGHLGGAPGQTVVLRAHAGILSPLGWKAPRRRWWPHFHITLYF